MTGMFQAKGNILWSEEELTLPRRVFLGCALSLALAAAAVASQSAGELDRVKRIYVGSFGVKSESTKLRESVIAELGKHPRLTVVSAAAEADAVLQGSGDVWVKGYYALNPRVREVGEGAQPLYGGFLSVELMGKENEPLWSWIATPKRSSADVRRDLASEIAKKLESSVASAPHRR